MNNIILKAKQQDLEALEQVIVTFRPMVGKIVSQFQVLGGDYRIDKDDLIQVANIALYKAVIEYDENRGAQFSTFAYTVVRRSVIKAVERYNRIYTHEVKSLDGGELSENWGGFVNENFRYDPQLMFRYKESIKKAAIFMGTLNEEEYKIISMRRVGKSYKEIAEKLGVSLKHVDYIVQKVRKQATKYIAED